MQANREWISISDLMAGLMMVFLFIAIIFMIQAESEKEAIENIALTYEKSKQELHQALKDEFEKDLEKWGAELLPDSTIQFQEPEVLFDRSSASIKVKFKEILDDFFPRYIEILSSEQFKEEIDEIRIEGHTSSLWREGTEFEDSYLLNAQLSQRRSYSVLDYVFRLEATKSKQNWMKSVLRANGLSFAKLIFDDNKQEDFNKSRRVEFRVATKAEEKIYTILKGVGASN
ncbi:MAG: OmpA family protein [Xanthomonadales bacterium]|nr:OmpA family protein [Xanthomonadales bacterium]MCB1584873.1 OmpA family protein [Xanthomonadales bacterium]